jgi:hypothetical protein
LSFTPYRSCNAVYESQGRSKTMNERPIRTAPLSRQDHLLRDKLIEDIAGQSARMDELARQVMGSLAQRNRKPR